MNDLTLAIKLTTEGGQVVVKDLSTIVQSSNKAADSLDRIQSAGQSAGKGLDNASDSSDVLSKHLKEQNQHLQRVVNDLARSAGVSQAAGRGFDQAAHGSQSLSHSLKQNDIDLNHVRGQMLTLVGVSAALYAGFAAFEQVRGLAQQADDFNVLQQRIKTATKETGDYNQVSAQMYAIAQANGAALAPTVELFQRLSSSRKDLKATNEQMLDFTDTVQKLGVIGGSSNQAMENGLLQLSQGLSGGILRAEEFNSILENIPELAVRIGKGMDDIGKSDNELGLGDLRKLVLEGKLLSDDVLKSILAQLPEISKEFADMPISMGRASVMADNAISAALARLDQASGVTTVWANTLVGISETLDGMDATELNNSIAALLAIAGGGAALLILSKYGIGLASVGAGYQALTGWLNTYRTVQVATTATVYNAATMTNLTVASNMNAARSYSVLAATAGAARGALALIGGPVGLAALAAWGIYEFASSSSEAEQKAQLMAKALGDAAGGFKDVGKESAAAKIAENLAQLSDVNADLVALERQLANAKKQMDAIGTPRSETQWRHYDVAVQKIVNLEEKIKATKMQQDALVTANQQLDSVVNPPQSGVNDDKAKADALNESLLKLYNTQMLNAQAIDAQGRALNGVDLELFKAKFKEATKLPLDAEVSIRAWIKTAEAATQLSANDKYLAGLTEEVRLQQVRLQLGEQEYELAKAVSSQKITDPKQLASLKSLLVLQRELNQVKSEDDALKALKDENNLLQIRLDKGESEYQLQKMIRQLKITDPAVITQLDLEIDRQRQLNEQLDVRKYLTDGTYDDVLDGLTQIRDAGSAAGNALVDAFGSVADQFANMAEQQDEFTKKFITLSEARKKAEKETDPARRTKALEKADAVERSLMEDQLRMQIGGYATLTGAASKMFSENSKGRQVLHRMETTFAAIETALALKKAAANAIAAITNQGNGDPYTAFGRIAAMMAIMAGLGVFSGGSSASGTSSTSRQESQGTGTVLGDSSAKSESIANSLERIESLELDQYAELQSINNSIRELSAGIKNLAVNLVANYGRFDEANYEGELGKDYNLQLGDKAAALVLGGVIGAAVDNMLGGLLSGITNKVLGGLFGSTKKELVDSGISFAAQQLGDILSTGLVNATLYDTIKVTKKKAFGLSKKTYEETSYKTLDNDIKAEFGRIFSYIGNSVADSVKLLGLETTKSLENFVIKLPNVSFKDLSGDEIEKELQAIFSQQGDLMVKYLVPGIAEFQQMGEGLYDTLIRVAQEQAVFNASMDSLGLQLSRFSGMTKALEIDVAQSLIELMGGIEEFSSATSDYFSEFYNEQEQLAFLTKQAQAQFASLGVAMPANREAFKALVGSLDLTSEAGQQMFAVLMRLNPAMDQFYDQAEQHAKDLAKWTQSINDELANLSTTELQRSLIELERWRDAQIEEAKELGAETVFLERLYAKKRAQIIEEELSRIADTTKQTFQSLANSILDIRKQMPGWDEVGYQTGISNDLRGQLGKGDLATQVSTIEQLQSALMSRYQAQMAKNSELMQQAQSKLDALNNSWTELQSQLANVKDSLASSILDLRKQSQGWDEVGYQVSQVNKLRSQLGAGSILEQISVVDKLQSAILGRYQAEIAASQQLQSAAQSRYEADLAAYDALKDAAKQLTSAADSLLLSDLSPAKMGDQFKEAQKQFNDLLRKARGGDVEAAQQLESVGGTYLQLAQKYLASGSSEYAEIFAQVQRAYRSFGSSIGSAPTVPREVLDYQKADALLQAAAIKELEELQTLLSTLEAQAKAEHDAATEAAKLELAQYQAKALELQTSAITELEALQQLLTEAQAEATAYAMAQISAITDLGDAMNAVASAIAAQPAPVVNVTAPAPVIVPPVVIAAPVTPPATGITGDNIGEPVTNPILERTNQLLQQQLQQQQRLADEQNRQMRRLQDDLQRSQAMIYEVRRQA